mgnify:CR=1 FL=1
MWSTVLAVEEFLALVPRMHGVVIIIFAFRFVAGGRWAGGRWANRRGDRVGDGI